MARLHGNPEYIHLGSEGDILGQHVCVARLVATCASPYLPGIRLLKLTSAHTLQIDNTIDASLLVVT